MRLTRLEIENFKGIGERQVIEIRPITLLFGPNSAGKSTILQAVEYLRQFLAGEFTGENSNGDSKNSSDIGNFESLVHCHDLSKIIKIKINVNVIEENLTEYFPINSNYPEAFSAIEKLFSDSKIGNFPIKYCSGTENNGKVTDIAVAVEVGRDHRVLEIDINHERIVRISPLLRHPSDSDSTPISVPYDGFNPFRKYVSRTHILEINIRHFLLKDFVHDDESEYDASDLSQDNIYQLGEESDHQFDTKRKQQEKWRGESDKDSKESTPFSFFQEELVALGTSVDIDSSSDAIGLDIADLNFQKTWEYSEVIDNYMSRENENFNELYMPIDLVPSENCSRTEKYSSKNGARWLRLEELLSELVFAPVRYALVAISFDKHDQPHHVVRSLRPIPERGKSQTMLDTSNDEGILRDVNFWLTQRFDLDYTIRRFHLKFEFEEQAIDSYTEGGLRKDDIPENFLPNISQKYCVLVKLYNKKRGIFLDIMDVGVGISQLVPVVIQALNKEKGGLIAMEQPELHLHPAVQVVLGDLFIASAREPDRTFLIETHSEHLLLRLLRRIEETTENELPPGTIGFSAEDISVIYVEPVHTEKTVRTRIKRLRVDTTGEFEDRWPNGFFEERAKELF